MKTLMRNYLHVLIAGQRRAESGDAALLAEFIDHRDGDAFGELLRRHGPMVLGLARRIVGDAQAAEDIFQATFLVLARRAHTLRRPDSLAAWLHGVAVRLALRTRKAGSRRRQQEAHASAITGGRDPLAELSARELLAVLDEELQRLPEGHRLPLILCGLEGLSQDEAARRLGWSAGAIKGRLERGRQHLRRRLAQRGLTLPAALAGSVLLADWAAAVPPTLVAATRQAALTGSGTSAAVTALAQHAVRTGLTRVKVALVLGMIATVSLGVGWWQAQAPGDANAPPAPVIVERADEPAEDALPEGAVRRLGTLERRAVGARLALSADGKAIIGVRGVRYVQVWDAASGQLQERHELEQSESLGPVGGIEALSPHGRLFATEDYTGQSLRVWDVLSGKILHNFPTNTGGQGGGGAGQGPIGVNAVAFSPDEKIVAAILRLGARTALHVWELKRGKELLDKEITAVGWPEFLVFTPDGKRLLVADRGGLAAFDVANGALSWHAKNVPTPIWHAFTPDGKLLIQNDGMLAFDLTTGNPAALDKRPPETWDGPLAVTPDGKTLLVAGDQGVLVWDLVNGKAVRTLADAAEQLVISADGRSLLTSNGALQRWDLDSGKALYPDTSAQGHVGEVIGVAFSADGKHLASGATDGTVRLWDIATGKAQRIWRGHEVRAATRLLRTNKIGVTALDIAPDGSKVVSAGSIAGGAQRVLVWDAGSDKCMHTLALPASAEHHVPALRIRADGTRVAAMIGAPSYVGTVGDDPPVDTRPRLATWDLATGELVSSVPAKGYAAVFAGRGDVMLGEGVVTDVATGRQLARLAKTESQFSQPPYAAAPDGALVATGLARTGRQDGVKFIGPGGGAIWEAWTGKRVANFPTHSWVSSLAVHPSGRHVAINDLDDMAIVDVTTGKIVQSFQMPEKIRAISTPGSYASCLTFSPDGRRLATGHPDGSILLWEVKLPQRQAAPLDAGELDTLWTDLANADAVRAWRAVWRLSDFPDAAVPLIRKHVAPVLPAPEGETRPLLEDLDSDQFEQRESAMTGLRKLGVRAMAALEKRLAAHPSVETKRRITTLLQEMEQAPPTWTPATLAQVRAVAALGQINSREARTVLEALAGGVRLAPVTRAARAALGRP
jgi:RNA polymerase sigma factor (sigma-70 family)